MGVLILLGAVLNSDIQLVLLLIIPVFMYVASHVVEKIGVNAGEGDKRDILDFIERELLATPSMPLT